MSLIPRNDLAPVDRGCFNDQSCFGGEGLASIAYGECRAPHPESVCFDRRVLLGNMAVPGTSFDVRRAEVKHTRLMVINPNDGMVVVLFHGEGLVRGGSIRKTSDPVHHRLRSIE